MGFCAFLLLKSCHCCWGNPFPRSINHKVQQHNNINMWRPDNSDWPDMALVENSLTKLIFLDPRDEISEADKEASSLLKVFAKKVFFECVPHPLLIFRKRSEWRDTNRCILYWSPMPIGCTHPSIPCMWICFTTESVSLTLYKFFNIPIFINEKNFSQNWCWEEFQWGGGSGQKTSI